MPTAEEFYAARGEVEELLGMLDGLASDIEGVRGQTGFVGATLETTLNSGITKATETQQQAVASGEQLIAELEHRARVCEAHAATLASWETTVNYAADEAAVEAAGPRPVPPYPWVEPQ